jgi:hypothetical protein
MSVSRPQSEHSGIRGGKHLLGNRIVAGKGFSNDIDEAIQWAETNVELLYQVWKKLNERD